MADIVSSDRVVKIRVQGTQPDPLCGQIVQLMEQVGFETIEWSKEYPTKEDPNVKRVFLTAIRKES
jgi:hypothetical protein